MRGGQSLQVLNIDWTWTGVRGKHTENKMATSTKPRWDDEYRLEMNRRQGETRKIKMAAFTKPRLDTAGGKSQDQWRRVEILRCPQSHNTNKTVTEIVPVNKFENSRKKYQLRHGMK